MLLKWMTAFPQGLETKRARGMCVRARSGVSEGVLGGPPDGPGLRPWEEAVKPSGQPGLWPGSDGRRADHAPVSPMHPSLQAPRALAGPPGPVSGRELAWFCGDRCQLCVTVGRSADLWASVC